MQENWPSVLFAMAGGVVLSLGNLSTQYAWAFVGLSVVQVISSSMTVVIGYPLNTLKELEFLDLFVDCNISDFWFLFLIVTGTTLNYFLDDKINRAEILFPGVGCFLVAVCLASAVHSSNAADDKAKLSSWSNENKTGTG